MDVSRRNRIVKIALVNVALLAVVLGFAELTARMLFPDFSNQVYSDRLSSGISYHLSDKPLGWNTRVPRAGAKSPAGEGKLFLVLGDSISGGFATAYEDIYWVKLSRLLAASGARFQFASPSAAGNTLEDSIVSLEAVLKHNHNVSFILYQFNQNDILPENRESLRKADQDSLLFSPLFARFAVWRYRYANYLVAARVLQYYGGVLIRRTTGNCEERGTDGLGQYTFSYGNRIYADEAGRLWKEFENRLLTLSKYARARGIGFAVFISPILYDIDKDSIHPYTAAYNLDFGCSTINPRSRLRQFSDMNGIMFIDPIDYVREAFQNRVAEGNFTPFYFPADDNHFTPTTGQYVAEYLFMKLQGMLKHNK